jgi:hypothetical protein
MLSIAVHADYQDGLDAYERGDYMTAMREWRAVTDGPATAANPAIYIEAHYAVAMLYWQGEGVAVDYRQAHGWLLKAAELGHADAQAKLGFLYADGKGVVQDHQKAFEWFSKAAKGGSVDGLYNLGVFYLYGWGVEQDTTLAAQYVAAAAALGDEAAEQALPGVLAQLEEDRSQKLFAPLYDVEASSPLLDETWIRAQDPNRFTNAVIALSSRERLEDLVRGHADSGPYAFFVAQKNDKPLYLLIQGSYPDREAARAGGTRIPAAIQRQEELLIRRFDGIQASLQ